MKQCNLKIVSCGSCRHPEYMTRKNASLCATDFPSIVGVIEHPQEGVVLFDTGYDAAFLEATRPFPERLYRWTTPVTIPDNETALRQLKKLGYEAKDIRWIIISHFHGDHVSGLHNFPNAKIVCSKRGLEPVYVGSRFGRVRKGLLSSLLPDNLMARAQFFENCTHVSLPRDFHPFSDAVDILGDNSILAVELPGHCPGHWGIALRTPQDRFAFLIGDAAWSIQAVEGNIPPPRLTTKLLGCTDDYYKTLGQLHILEKERRNIAILPSHCKIATKRFEEVT